MVKYLKALLFAFLTTALLGSSTQHFTFIIKGSVIDEHGKGIADVVVNNGVQFTSTNADGSWELATDTASCKFISISTPSDYHLTQTDGIATGFYVPVSEAVSRGNVTFRLKKRTSASDSFHYIVISDPQILNEHDMQRWKAEAVPDIMHSADSLRNTAEVVVMTLGDLVFDNMKLFSEYRNTIKHKGITTFQCIGNHDFDNTLPDLNDSKPSAKMYAEQLYEKHFGPTNYSFNIDKAHVITMKNINYHGNKRYKEHMTDADLSWLRHDLSYVPKGTLVILNMHAPAWNQAETYANMDNGDDLRDILSGYDVHVFCGHTHFLENVEVTPTLYQHNIGAACGTWWAGDVNRCGAPNGYMIIDVNGKSLRWHYKGNRLPLSEQMYVYAKGEFKEHPNDIVANIWDWDSRCRTEWYQDGKPMGAMRQVYTYDQRASRLWKKDFDKARTRHLFLATPFGQYRTIRIVFTNRFGEKFEKTISNKPL